MKNTLCLLLLSFSLQRIKCQSMESIESTTVKKPGETLTLSCRGSGFSFGSWSMYWIRQQAGKPLVWMGRVYSDSSGYDYSESFKGRTEITRDNSKSMVYLKLSGLTAEDSAVYYCAKQIAGDAFDYWGKGTMVTVRSAQPSPPKSIFAMSQCTPDSNGTLIIGCMARGFSPVDSLTFKWTHAKKELSDVVQYPAFGPDGDHTKISHVRISKSNLDPLNPYTCEASNSGGSPLEVKVPIAKAKAKAPDGMKLSLSIYRPDSIGTGPVSHVCEINGTKLDNVDVMWKVGDGPYREGTTFAPINQKGSTSILSILTMTKEEYNDLKTTITCAVKHASKDSTSSPTQVSTSKSETPEPDTGFALDCNKDVLEEDEFRSLWSTATSFIFLFLFSLTYSAVLSFFKVKQ